MGWKRNSAVVGGLALAVSGFLALGWMLGASGEANPAEATPSTSVPSASVGSEDGASAAEAAEAVALPPRAPAPLPGALPATELAAILLPRAQAGDAVAACRLALELAECRVARRWRLDDSAAQSRSLALSGTANLEQLKALEAQLAWREWQKQRKDDCEALPEDLRDRGPQLMLQAALQGNRRAMVGFASLRGVGGEALVADPGLYAQYRHNAFSVWRQAFESGSVDALPVWMSALDSNGFEFFAGVLPDEFNDRALAQATLLEVYRALQIDPAKTMVAPRVDAAAIDPDTARRAQRLFDRHFRDSQGLAVAREHFARLERRRAALSGTVRSPAEHWAVTAAVFDEGCSAQW